MGYYLGQIISTPYTNFVRSDLRNFEICDGRLLDITDRDFSPLFDLIGYRFGGDGKTTFAVPDLRDFINFPPPFSEYQYFFHFRIATWGIPPSPSHPGPDMLLGEIMLLPDTIEQEPYGTMKCDGRLLPVNYEYAHLYSLVGTKFGGDGIVDFAIPDMRQQAPEGLNYCIVTKGIYPHRSY